MTQAILKQFRAEGGFKTNPSSNFGDVFATKLDVDNLIIDNNAISTKLANQNLNLVTTGTGAVSTSRIIVNSLNAQSITGNLTGNVTGNLTGNVTGNLTGNVTGNLTGNVTSSGSSLFNFATINGGAINDTPIGNSLPSTATFTSVVASNITGPIGLLTRNNGQFLSLSTTGNVTITSEDNSDSISSGSIVASGGAGIAKNVNIGGSLTVLGTAQAAPPENPEDLANKIYVDDQSVKNLAFSVAFGL